MKARVLIADDESLVRRMLTQGLTARGHTVDTASDGRKALEIIDAEDFDVVVCDILMPETDGLEVIIHLRKHKPNLPVIAISGPGNHMFLKNAQGLGAARIFEKPFEVSDLAAAIDELLVRQ